MQSQKEINLSQTKNYQLKTIQKDLINEVEKYPNITIAYKAISTGSEISIRTLQRLMKGSTEPSLYTALRLYRYILGTTNERDTLLQMPNIFKKEIAQNHENYALTSNEVILSTDVDLLISNDSIFRFIYIHTTSGALTKEKVGFEYGRQGLKVLNRMLQLDVITESEPGLFSQGKKRAVINPESIHAIAKQLLDNHYSVNKADSTGENFSSIIIHSLDLNGYNEMLKFEWETKKQRQKLLKSLSDGPIKFWTIHFIDTLSSDLLYPDNAGEL